jgi:hypothetical protein
MKDNSENPYAEYCPSSGDVERFTAGSVNAVAIFKDECELLPPKVINSDLGALRKVISRMSKETREIIGRRELEQWQNSRSNGAFFDEEYFQRSRDIFDGGSLLDKLDNCLIKDFRRSTPRRNAGKRKDLLRSAAFLFSVYGGKIEGGINSMFVRYVTHLFEEVDLTEADCSKAVRDFIKKNPGVLD